ncbi:uncharacterized protein F4807DRAFT_467029 [Annulohypoxylon truncatum]|uniref:uncharacterized protein n=1 Tax=Annulohypoxylon truncatum TaxID=327061 RepID=UPI0020078F01|nr:uncharacterized protein F4807DRAFT_467029 [Annulohypoxylon truncatum]KAI1210735.1 hypothetical protein F4807DRAFT_467029 [Annulohypoxylon truncatum]
MHFTSKADLHNHFMERTDDNHFWCEKCAVPFMSHEEFHQHTVGNEAHFRCTSCRIDFDLQNALQDHKMQSPAHHYCSTCNKDYDDAEFLDLHMLKAHHQVLDSMSQRVFSSIDLFHRAMRLYVERNGREAGAN